MWSLIHGLGTLVVDGLLVPGTAGLPRERVLVARLVDVMIDGVSPR